MTGHADFYALLDKEPEDWTTMLVFADWLEEEPQRSTRRNWPAAWRWIAEARLAPVKLNARTWAYWNEWSLRDHPYTVRGSCLPFTACLPGRLYHMLGSMGFMRGDSQRLLAWDTATASNALVALSLAVLELRACGINPLGSG